MTPKELLDAGDLAGTIQALNQSLRDRPTDSQLRIFLFEALCFAGDYGRATRQLDVLSTQVTDPANALALGVYRQLLAAEQIRQQVFAGTALPKFLVTPTSSIERYTLLLARLARGESVSADYADAEEQLVALSGELGEAPFSFIRDIDDRLAPILEVFHGSEYLWIPFEQIRSLEIAPPKRLRELLWAPAVLEIEGQPAGDVFIPVLYVNSHQHPNDLIKLGRITEWNAIDDAMVVGAGQRVLAVDDDDHPLLSVRRLRVAAAT